MFRGVVTSHTMVMAQWASGYSPHVCSGLPIPELGLTPPTHCLRGEVREHPHPGPRPLLGLSTHNSQTCWVGDSRFPLHHGFQLRGWWF